MKQEIYRLDCGRGFEVVLVQTNADEHDVFEYFDVELHYSQCYVITLATKAIGNKSGDYWALSTEKIMKKIIFIADSIDMAAHNLMCYSRNLLMNSPKDGYADECSQWANLHRIPCLSSVGNPHICRICIPVPAILCIPYLILLSIGLSAVLIPLYHIDAHPVKYHFLYCRRSIEPMGIKHGISREIQGWFRGKNNNYTNWYQISD